MLILYSTVDISVVQFYSVVMKADKKLLTVLFPDGGDGRAFTLKVISLSLSLKISFKWNSLIFPYSNCDFRLNVFMLYDFVYDS